MCEWSQMFQQDPVSRMLTQNPFETETALNILGRKTSAELSNLKFLE